MGRKYSNKENLHLDQMAADCIAKGVLTGKKMAAGTKKKGVELFTVSIAVKSVCKNILSESGLDRLRIAPFRQQFDQPTVKAPGYGSVTVSVKK